MNNDAIRACLSSEYSKDKEKSEFLSENIISKKDTEIMDFLTFLKPEEIGGLTAISGFYFQFLVTIEYFIELLDGKWDFVAFELHDDIVVGNEKDKKIRFVQVKTSNKNSHNPSKVSDLYLGTLKKDSKTKEEFRLKDSWVDKLISKSRFFKKEDNFTTQFQIYTSYHVVKTSNYNFDHYTDNELFNKSVKKTDSLLKVLQKNTHDATLNKILYEDICGESTEELLSRLQIKTGSYMADINRFRNDLIVELSKRIFKSYKKGNISLDIQDIHFLIGMLCSRCDVNGDARYLKVTREDLEEILKEIGERAIKNNEEMNEEHGNIKILERIFSSYLEEVEGTDLYDNILDKAYTYKEYLIEWIEQKGNIRDLFNRYVDGTVRSQTYFKTQQNTREKTLGNLISLMILINIVYDEVLMFGENKFLLTKRLKNLEKNEILSFLNTGKNNLEKSIEKINLILDSADESEHLYLLDKDIKIILQNYSDRSFQKATKRELKSRISIDDIEGLDEESDINKTSLSSMIIPGKIIQEGWDDCLSLKEFQELVNEITKLWYEVVDTK